MLESRPIAARGETPAAFGRRCIPSGCVAPRSNTPGILARRALPSGRIAALGATLDFHHGLLDEGAETGDRFADDERVHFACAFIRVERFGIGEEAGDLFVEKNAVAPEQL